MRAREEERSVLGWNKSYTIETAHHLKLNDTKILHNLKLTATEPVVRLANNYTINTALQANSPISNVLSVSTESHVSTELQSASLLLFVQTFDNNFIAVFTKDDFKNSITPKMS